VRSTGPVNPLTKQPIKGRKFGGGIRFGEMERDALLAHGAAYLLHDRLHTASDYSVADVCAACGSLLTACAQPATAVLSAGYHPGGGGAPRRLPRHVQAPDVSGLECLFWSHARRAALSAK